MIIRLIRNACAATLAITGSCAWAACGDVSSTNLIAAYEAAAAAHTGGYEIPAGLNMWVTLVDETGKVCQVYTKNGGATAGNSAWLGSRVISAQKANTANAFSLDGYAISTANLYTAVQGENSLFGLQFSNPVDASEAYVGNPANFGKYKNGKSKDPLVGKRIGGVNVFGGGLALYNSDGKKIGAIGVSGDTSCRDHAFAWRMRTSLAMHPMDNGKWLPNNQAKETPDAHAGAGETKGTGITTYNIDKNGVVQSVSNPLKDATYGDEMVLRGGTADSYWTDNWSHPTCPGSILNIAGGQSTNTKDNGILIDAAPAP